MSIAATAEIHPSAVIEEGARIGEGVRIGPYCVVGPSVVLGEGVRLEPHVVVSGDTEIGPRTHVFPFAAIGNIPQDLKYAGEHTILRIGADNRIREHVTMNPGTEGGGGETTVGDGCLFMAGSHVAHDCRVGNGVIFANNATCAGHVIVGDHAVLGGLCAIHQFARIGRHAMIGGMTGVEKDVIPYGSVIGNRAALGGLNVIGMKRRGFGRSDLQAAREAYRMIFESSESDLAARAAAARAAHPDSAPVGEIVEFLLADTLRGFCTPRTGHG